MLFRSSDPETGVTHGSGRSIPAFHLLEALETMPDLFTKFGGHRQAAGVTLPSSKVGEFRERFRAYAASRLTADDFEAVIDVDAEAELPEIAGRAVADLMNLAPFGFGNSAPLLVVRGVELAADPEIKNEKHVFFRFRDTLRNNGRPFRAKAWNFAERVKEITSGAGVAAVYDSVGRDTFDRSLECLAPLGTLALYGQSSGPVPAFDLAGDPEAYPVRKKRQKIVKVRAAALILKRGGRFFLRRRPLGSIMEIGRAHV